MLPSNAITCPFCGSKTAPKYQITRFSSPFSILECPACLLQFQHPLPGPEQIKAMYGPGYYGQENEFQYEDERRHLKYYRFVWEKRIQKLSKNLHTTGPRKILDMGCSFGGLLQTAENYGFEGYGVEISAYAREYAARQMPDRIFETLESAPWKENFFDAISLIEVIEHLDAPLKTLKQLWHLMKPGGLLLLQTANMAGRQARKAGADYHYYLPGHLFYFSKANLRQILLATGFKKIKFFHPVEFGLLAKLKKSRGFFSSPKDYKKWAAISWYHFKGLWHTRQRALTSSMVIYAWK